MPSKSFVPLLIAMAVSVAFAEPPATPASNGQKRVRGTVLKVGEGSITVRPEVRRGTPPDQPAPETLTLPTDAHTQLRIDGNPATLTDLAPGMKVDYVPFTAKGDRPAMVMLAATSEEVDGTIVSIAKETIAVQATTGASAGNQIEVPTNADTRFVFVGVGPAIPPRRATLEELTPGTRVKIRPATGIARVVHAIPKGAAATQPAK